MDQMNNMMPMMPMGNKKYKTQLCRHVASGRMCQLGENCQFAHSYDELRSFPDAPQNYNPMPKQQTKSNYKTIPCKYFQQGCFCKNQDNCTFAHGDLELRQYTGMQQAPQGSQNPYYQPMNMYDQQQAQMPPMMPPNPQQQLNLINVYIQMFTQIEQTFQNDEFIAQSLNKVGMCLQNSDVEGLNSILMEIMNEPSRTQQERDQLNIIVENMFEIEKQMNAQYMMNPPMQAPIQPYDEQQMQQMQQMHQMQQYPQMPPNEMNIANQQGGYDQQMGLSNKPIDSQNQGDEQF